jgi:hypothetical protein
MAEIVAKLDAIVAKAEDDSRWFAQQAKTVALIHEDAKRQTEALRRLAGQ